MRAVRIVPACLAAGLLFLVSVVQAATTKAILQVNVEKSHRVILIGAGSVQEPILAFSCREDGSTLGVALSLPPHETWPVDGAEVVIRAGDTSETKRFWTDGKYLVFGGEPAKTLFARALTSDQLVLTVGGETAEFALGTVRVQVSRFRELCRLG